MMKTLDRTSLKSLLVELDEALAPLSKKYGMAFKRGTVHFDANQFHCKLECRLLGDGSTGPVEKPERVDFIKFATDYGMDPIWLDLNFQSGVQTYTIKGLYPNRRKNCVLVERNGKQYIMPADTVVRGMTGTNAARNPVNTAVSSQISEKVRGFVRECNDHRDVLFTANTNEWDKKDDELEAQLKALDKEAGEGLCVGRTLKFAAADGYAKYIIVSIGAREVEVAHIPLGDAYQFSGVYENASGKLVVPRPVAEKQVQMSSFWNKRFA